MAKRKGQVTEEVVEAEEAPTLPEQYKLGKGDRFEPFNADAPEFADVSTLLENYTTSLGDEPRESDDEGNPTPHTIGITTWFDVERNEVKVFDGTDDNGKASWKVDPFARKFVVSLKEDDFGSLIGEIRNSRKETEQKFAQQADEAVRALQPEEVSFTELINESK